MRDGEVQKLERRNGGKERKGGRTGRTRNREGIKGEREGGGGRRAEKRKKRLEGRRGGEDRNEDRERVGKWKIGVQNVAGVKNKGGNFWQEIKNGI